MNTPFSLNNMITSLKEQEINYPDSGSASKEKREFIVGYCDTNLNGLRVMKLHQKIYIEHKIFGPAYLKYTFEGDLTNSKIIGWRINCNRPFNDNYGGDWKRINRVIDTDHFQFHVTSCFMRDLYWEIDIYYI